jgi:uncharacterized membrane protein
MPSNSTNAHQSPGFFQAIELHATGGQSQSRASRQFHSAILLKSQTVHAFPGQDPLCGGMENSAPVTGETSRIEAFSDGIFSIAATLLVLNLKPPPTSMPFWQGIAAQWPGFASFLLSFLFIGIMWINHHRMFTHVQRADDVLMVTNLLLLLGVVWIPYPTSLMAQAISSGRVREAAILYNGSYLAIALLFNLLLETSIRRGLVDRDYVEVRTMTRRYAVGPGLYVLSFAITWWNVPLSLAINGAMAVYFLLSPDSHIKRHARHSA